MVFVKNNHPILNNSWLFRTPFNSTFDFIRLRLVALNPIICSQLLWSLHQIESCLTFRAKRFKMKGLHLLYASLVHCFELKLLQIFHYLFFSWDNMLKGIPFSSYDCLIYLNIFRKKNTFVYLSYWGKVLWFACHNIRHFHRIWFVWCGFSELKYFPTKRSFLLSLYRI